MCLQLRFKEFGGKFLLEPYQSGQEQDESDRFTEYDSFGSESDFIKTVVGIEGSIQSYGENASIDSAIRSLLNISNTFFSIKPIFEASCFNSGSEAEPFAKILESRGARRFPGHSSQHSEFSFRKLPRFQASSSLISPSNVRVRQKSINLLDFDEIVDVVLINYQSG